MNSMFKRLLACLLSLAMVISVFPASAITAFAVENDGSATVSEGNVAKVGNTEYATIDEAIANWTNGSTLTLLADVTLSGVIQLSSTEYHILDLGTYTMTAASKKDAIQIVNNGRSSASYALDIKADATDPGGITASGKAVVRTTGKSGVKDRPIIRFYNGVFTGTNVVYHSGSNGTNCPQFQFHGGVFNGTIFANRALMQFFGGTFNGSLQMSVDSSAYALIAGGTFSKLSNLYGSTLSSGKFTIGSAKGVYDREVYIDDNGNYVVAAAEPAEGYEAAVAKTPGTNDYLAYSKVATEGVLNYTDATLALKNNKTATVTVYTDTLDLAGINFTGTIVVPEGQTLTITNAPEGLNVQGSYKIVRAVAQIGSALFYSLEEAFAAAQNDDTIKLLDNVTLDDTLVNTKNITLDLNGKTISQVKVQTAGYQMILNDGNLTINDTVGGGKISYTDSGNGGNYISDTIYNRGTLVINGGTIENLSSATVAYNGYPHAVDTYSGLRDTSVTINDGTIYCENYSAIRMFCVSAAYKADLVINGGTIQGAVDMQNGTVAAANGSLTVNGGTFKKNASRGNIRFANWNSGATGYGITASIKAGTFDAGIVTNYVPAAANWNSKIISGGTFGEEISEDLCAEGYIPKDNGNGTYSVVVEPTLVGSGTEEDPYQIGSVEDLILFRDSVNAGETKYNAPGVYVALTADIDMAGATWERGIGDGINATYDGIFDGKNFTIKNLNLAPKADSDKYFCGGLFGYTYGAAVIKNLVLENITVTANGEGHNVGALVGFANNNGGKLTVTNVTVKNVTIDAPNAYGVGAIVGYSYRAMGTIENCIVDGAVINGYSFVGGITGYSYSNATITGCTVKNATITATSKGAGGIVGIALSGNKVTGNTVADTTVTAQTNWGYVVGEVASEGIVVENNNAAMPQVGGSYATGEAVQAMIGSKYYTTFAAAYAAAKDGDTIVLLAPIVVNAGETLTLDKNVTITYTTDVAGEAMITNKGTLILANGKVEYTYTGAATTAKAANAISNYGTLTVDGAAISNTTASNGQIGYAIDNFGALTVNSGSITATGSNYYDGIRMFCASETVEVSVTVNGGEISSIWMQNASDGASERNTKDVLGSLTITGGKIANVWLEPSAQFAAAISGGNIGKVAYNETASGRDLTGFITGGTFSSPVAEDFCAEGYISVDNGDGTYGVVVHTLTGSGTQADPFRITNAADLKLFAEKVNAGIYKNVYAELAADIDLEQEDWTPIGNSTNPFLGVFDGKGYTISNLWVTPESGNAGLFGQVGTQTGNKGTVKNLTVENATIIAPGQGCAGVIAVSPLNSLIENVKLTGEITIQGYRGVGGIVGNGFPTINNCTVEAEGTIHATYWGVGGILGFASDSGAKVNNATVKGVGEGLTISSYLGGAGSVTGTPYGAATNGATVSDLVISSSNNYYMAYVDAGGTVNGTVSVTNVVVKVNDAEIVGNDAVASVGTKGYFSLQDAIDAAGEGDTVVLLKDITVSSDLNNAAKGLYNIAADKKITIDLNGKTIDVTDNSNGNFIVFYNYGDLTIKNGTVYLTATIDRAFGAQSTIILNRGGNLTVESGYYEHKGGDSMAFVLDNSANSYGDAYMTIKGGTFKSTYTAIRMRMADPTLNGNPGNGVCYLTVEDGEIYGAKRGIWGQITNASALDLGALTITGGTVEGGVDAIRMTTDGNDNIDVSISGEANIVGNLYGEAADYAISGGTFNNPVDKDFCADGYIPVDNGDGTYGVKAGAYVAEVNGTKYETLAEALAAAQAGDTVYIYEGTYAMPSMKAGITIEGMGNVLFEGTLSGTLENLTLKNIHIKGGNAQRWAYAKGDLVFENVTFEATSVYALHFDGITAGATLTYKDCTIIGWAAMSGSPANCTFDGCTFKGNGTYGLIRTYFDATIENCTFDVANVNTNDSYQDGIHAVSGATVTVTNCVNSNGDMKDIVNVSGDSAKVVLDGVVIRNVAKIGDTYYKTLAEAIAAAQDGDTIVLLTDIDLGTGSVTVKGKEITLDLNGHNITGSGYRVLVVDLLRVDNADKRGVLTLTGNGTVENTGTNSGNSYAVYVGGSSDLIVKADATVKSANGYAVAMLPMGAGRVSTVTVDGGTVTGKYAISGNGTLTDTSTVVNVISGTVSGTEAAIYQPQPGKVNISGGTINGGTEAAIGMRRGTLNITGGTVNGTIDVLGDYSAVSAAISGGDFTNATLKYADGNTVTKAESVTLAAPVGYKWNAEGKLVAIVYVAEVNGTKYETLAEALAAAQAGETIKLLAPIVVNAGETLEIDLAGRTIEYTSDVAGEDMITNYGTLTINDSVGGGKIIYTNNDTTGSNVTVSTITNAPGGLLTVNGGTIENARPADIAWNSSIYAFAIDNVTNGTLGAAKTVINGGVIKSTYRSIRLFANSTSDRNTVNINGGEMIGQVWLQAANSNAQKVSLVINDGSFAPVGNDASSVFVTTLNNTKPTFRVFDGYFATKIGTDNVAMAANYGIVGGTFSAVAMEKTPAGLVRSGYEFTQNADGTYGVETIKVASVTDANGNVTKYANIRDAVNALTDGATLTLLQDTTYQLTFSGVNATLDLNGKNITVSGAAIFVEDSASLTVVDNAGGGKITSSSDTFTVNNSALVIENGEFESTRGTVISASYATVTVNGGKLVAADNAISMIANSATEPNTLTINGGEIVAGSYAIATNGTYDNSTIIITGGKLTGTEGGIYHSAEGELTISGGEISGNLGVNVLAGKVTVSDNAVITGTNAAISVYYQGAATGYGEIEMAITGGTVNGAVTSTAADGLEAKTGFITGGNFTTDVTDLCADGYHAADVDSDGVYTVEVHDYSELVGYTEPTTESDGYWTYKCSCGATEIRYNEGTKIPSDAIAYIEIGGVKNYYNNLMVALNSAAAGQTVVLMTNIDAGMIVIVPQNVTLDLNGYVVEADNFLSYGDVIDGAIGGVGGIEIPFNAYTILAQNNSFLPLYDSANGIYRLYKYEAKSLGVATVSDDKANFWFTIIFENHSAYQLLKNGDTGLTLEGILTWTGMTHDAVHVTIVQSSIDQWADAVQGGANAGSAGVYIGVTGLSTLEGGNVTIKPVLETKAGVQTNFTDLVKTVG